MNWLKYKYFYFIISTLMIGVSIFSLLTWKLNLGVDFQGGTLVEYRSPIDISTETATETLEENNLEVQSIQSTGEDSYLFRLQSVSQDRKEELSAVFEDQVFQGEAEELRFETVGPSIGPELVKKTGYAISIAAILILIWVAYQFKSITYGASAILAMFHDSFILVGAFSLFGHFFDAGIDFLFVTGLLTTLSFSVHDTIVVFDRIREIRKGDEEDLETMANQALTETMVRSLNNSFTIIFMLVALLLLGGTTIKWFAAALLVGTVLGTYSSPFVATPLLVTFDEWGKTIKNRISNR